MQPTSPFWFSIAAMFFTLVGLIYNYFNNKATNEKSEQAIRLYQGFLEINLKKNRDYAVENLHKTQRSMLFFREKYPNGNINVLKFMEEDNYSMLISNYNKICMLYLDGKLDKKRCEIEYKNEIKHYVEDEFFQKKIFKKNRFTSLHKVYEEWENLEK